MIRVIIPLAPSTAINASARGMPEKFDVVAISPISHRCIRPLLCTMAAATRPPQIAPRIAVPPDSRMLFRKECQ